MATQTIPAGTPVGFLAQKVVSVPSGNLPGRWLLHAGPGWGKTSFGAYFPKPVFLQSRGETGLQTLIEFGQLKPTPHLPEAQSWADVQLIIKALRTEEHDFRTLVIDTINGLELLARQFVIATKFDGSESDFMAYGKGSEVMATEWNKFLTLLDMLRAERKMIILMLCHTKIKTFNNPTGNNYDRYTPEMTDKIFAPTLKWVDGALFGAFETQVIGRKATKPDQKVKVSSDIQERVLYTEETAAWSAKQRHGLPPEIECGESAEVAFNNFMQAVKNGKAVGLARSNPEPVAPVAQPQPEPESVASEPQSGG